MKEDQTGYLSLTDLATVGDLPWLNPLWQQLLQRHHRRRLPHGILLTGRPGIGKMALAASLCQRLLCVKDDSGASEACGQCQSCQWFQVGSHPDFQHLQPAEKGKAIRVDEVRELVSFMQQTASRDHGYKVVLIEPAEAMNINAANALLKTLEEPSAGAILVLVSHHVGQLLPTIRSRCWKLSVPSPSYQESLTWLQQQQSVADYVTADAEQALCLSQNAPLGAEQLLKDQGLAHWQLLEEQLSNVLQNRYDPIYAAQQLLKSDLLTTVRFWQIFCCELSRLAVGSSSPLFDKGHPARERLDELSPQQWFAFQDELASLRMDLMKRLNPNPQLTLEHLMLLWQQVWMSASTGARRSAAV